jgi:predicted nucleic acid-binding protein
MKLYLDNCAIQRPLDDKTQIRIALESEAILGIISLVENNEIELVSSDILEYEISKTPNIERREYAYEFLKIASSRIKLSDSIVNRAQMFEQNGIKAMDALHLATAVNSNIDYFCTCDDKFLKKILILNDLKLIAGTPLDLIKEIEK